MDSIDFFQVFIIIIILIMTLFYIYFRSLTSSSSAAVAAAVDTDLPPLQEKYDVFISFRGEDTRDAFTSHLHKALLGKKIETYMDYRLEKGDDIGPALLEAIEKSKIALVIFSKDYASSTWCLKELVHILGRKKSHGQIVIPIFYRIDPSHVRKQKGTYALGGLLWRLKKRFKGSMDEVANWRAALEEAANMSGFHYSSKTGTEADFVEEVVQDVLTKLNRKSSGDLKGLVGIEKKIEEIESLLCFDSPGVCCVGIWGMGGIGKTTLADAVFHRHSSKFEGSCFLANVREKSEKTDGLHQLRNKLVGEILKEKAVNIDTPSIPLPIQDRLRRTKALIVLDDVNDEKQLEDLVGENDWFCQGSRIIITARDKGLLELKVDQAKIFNVEGLGSDDALRLFYSHAKPPTTDYSELSREVVEYIKGIPLALKVMGSLLHRCKSKQEWEDQWKKLKQFPSKEIEKVLRISYDGLEENEKEIFLDIACFHKHSQRNDVKKLLDSRGFVAEVGINDLIDRSLISISKEGWSKGGIVMHDLVEEMGRAIARKQGSRLFVAEDVYQVLTNNQSDGRVQAISIDWLEMEYANFEKMHQLRWLHVPHSSSIGSLGLPNSLRYLHWYQYPLKSLPSKFSAQNLLVLEMHYSQVVGQLWNEDQSPVNLKRIDLSDCMHLTKVPDLSRSLQIEHIDLNMCESLVEVPSYFQHLSKLTYLDLERCTNLKNLPEMPCNLEVLLLSDTAIEELPSSVWSHEKISRLDITSCKHLKSLPSNTCKLKLSLSLEGCDSLCEFWELPRDTTELALTLSTIKELRNASIESVVGLTAIKLNYCESVVSLPTNIGKLKSLKTLDLENCSNFQNFPEISEVMEYLEFLNLSGTAVKEVPPSIGNLVALRELDLHNCKNLEVVPDELFCLTSLQVLNLSMTEIKSLPASIKQAAQLSRLFLDGCKSLESLPELPPSLKAIDLSWCSKFQYFPKILEHMEHLEFLNLSGTAVKELPPSIGNLVALRELDLHNCKNLEVVPDELFCLTSLQVLNLSETEIKSLPANIKQAAQLSCMFLNGCKSLESLPELPPSLKAIGWDKCRFSPGLERKHMKELPTNKKCLESIDLSGCPKLYFLEISEVMEYLEFLNLSGTAVKELPPSIGNLVALRELDLHNCKSLEVVPDELFCLTSLQVLNLSGTEIKSLPASIKQAAQLSRMVLNSCKSLESLPELPPSLKAIGWDECRFSPWLQRKHMEELPMNKKCLESIDLSGCSKLYFPEILEPMKHLEFLNLSGTAVKELPPSIGNLVALRELDLHNCKNLEVVPDELFCLTSLQVLNLSGTGIKSLPASIKQAARLSRLFLDSCKSLESLPELPPLLQWLDAGGCTSLKTVSSSSTALAQGWEKYKLSPWLHEKHIFYDCPKLDENARSNIMGDAQLRIMRMATASSKFKEDKIEKASYNSNEEYSVGIRCCGNEIPKWFSHKSEGCSIKIELPRDWFSTDFLGFALSLVVVGASSRPRIGCKYNFKTSNGESCEVNHPLGLHLKNNFGSESFPFDEVFVWRLCGAQSPTAFYKLVTEVNVDFSVWCSFGSGEEVEVKKCGICLLYGKDAEMIKQRAL